LLNRIKSIFTIQSIDDMDDFFRFNAFLLSYTDFTNEELNTFNEMCTLQSFKKGDVIIKRDEVSASLYFLTKGIVKYSIISHSGEEVIYNFRQESMTITAYSYYNHNIAKFNVECLEDCKLICVPIEAVGFVAQNFKNGAKLRSYLAEAHVLELVNLLTEKDSKSIMERYVNIDIQFPNIHQRVSQSTIANYLGVSQEHLSRLKKLRIDKNQ
jgi:CRP-like cAMP-binding protein